MDVTESEAGYAITYTTPSGNVLKLENGADGYKVVSTTDMHVGYFEAK